MVTLFMWRAEKLPQKLGGHKNVSKKAWRAKFTLIKTSNRASLIFNIPLSTIITSNPMKCNSNSFNCVLFYQVLHYFQCCSKNLNFKKIQRALENVLAGTFLPSGSGLATPGIDSKLVCMDSSVVYTCQNYFDSTFAICVLD